MSAPFVSLEQMLMFVVARLGSDAHGLAVRQEVKRATGRDVSPGAVYTTMERLEKKGAVASELRDGEGGGRVRKYYRLLPEGAAALQAGFTALEEMAREALPAVERIAGSQVSLAGEDG